jgi:hypothetical protein
MQIASAVYYSLLWHFTIDDHKNPEKHSCFTGMASEDHMG